VNTELLELYYFYFRTFTTCTFSEPTLPLPNLHELPRQTLPLHVFRMPVAESVAVVSCTASARAQPHARQHRTRTHARRTHANTPAHTKSSKPHAPARTQAARASANTPAAQTPAPQRPASCASSEAAASSASCPSRAHARGLRRCVAVDQLDQLDRGSTSTLL